MFFFFVFFSSCSIAKCTCNSNEDQIKSIINIGYLALLKFLSREKNLKNNNNFIHLFI